jgi:hypothetical protein
MKLLLRCSLLLALLTCSLPALTLSTDENISDAQVLAQLELRAQQASPRDQCYLYTDLVNRMTELAGRQMLNGDIDQAAATLKKVNEYAKLIHSSLAEKAKRLKNAEMLMERTTYRLGEYVHKASAEDRETLNATLKQLNQVHDELLAEVMKH